MTKEQISKILQQAASQDHSQWATERAPAMLPPGCPSMARMYTAVLREDWAEQEVESIRRSPQAQRLLQKVRQNVWYPTPLQLFRYAHGLLAETERADVQFHLDVDRCKRRGASQANHLPPVQFKLLTRLIESPGSAFRRQALLHHI